MYIVILLALLISYPLLSQPFLYDRYGKLKYIVSDSLLKEIPSESASMFMEHYKTSYFRMGGHIIGYSTTKVFKLDEDKVEIPSEDEETKEKIIYYVTDTVQQSQYINMFKGAKMDAVILTHHIDQPFVSQLEAKNEEAECETQEFNENTELAENEVACEHTEG